MGQALSGSRNLFALAEQGDLPRFFGVVHPRFRTPVNAILFTAAVSLVLAVSGRFAPLAWRARSAGCSSTCDLRRDAAAADRGFAAGPTADIRRAVRSADSAAAIVIALAILAGATTHQLIAGVVALGVGAVLYLVAVGLRGARST